MMTHTIYASAKDAIAALADFDARELDTFQYEIEALFDNERHVAGWRVRAKNLNGFFERYA